VDPRSGKALAEVLLVRARQMVDIECGDVDGAQARAGVQSSTGAM